jgi:diguanylate cyclase (GGDEF)-like protein
MMKMPQELDKRATDIRIQDIEIRLLELAYRNIPVMLLVNIAASIGAVVALSGSDITFTHYWLYSVFILTILRFFGWLSFTRAIKLQHVTTKMDYHYWVRMYEVGLYTSAIFWVGLFAACLGVANQEAKYTLSIIISALAGGATGVTAPLKIPGRIYITLLLFTSSLSLALLAPTTDAPLSALCFIFLLAMLMSHNNNHKVVRQSLTLQQENAQLIKDLREANTSLERRVAKRTEALKRIAYRDALTGLSNRRDILEWMETYLDESKSGEAAILFLDLDRFKQINDAMGHDIGDQVLQMIAMRFKEALPEHAILGRWGGDEFIIVTEQSHNSRENAEALAKKLIEIAIAPFSMNGEKLGIGLSVGIAYFPSDADSYKDVIQAADLSVAEVKRTGRGKALTYTETYAETQRRRFDLSRALSDAIAENQLFLVYQPIVSAKTGQVVALEALARWHHPELGQINPEEFIHLAEDTDRIVALGDWVLRTACATASSWNIAKVAVNISIKQLLSENFLTRTNEILAETHLPATQLQLEVTESLFDDENIELTLETASQLQKIGVEIHIDDFGTGYSSLSRLHQFPVNTIKIDRSFIAQTHEQSNVIIESTLMIAKHMHLKVIAEGIENAEQAKALSLLGVDYLQGFYFSMPEKQARLNTFANTWMN